MQACFGPEISADIGERNHRFLEEALELVQTLGCTRSEAHQLVDYVYSRPPGDPPQEVGGVMVTLAALCLAADLDMHGDGERELARVWTKVEAIRAKQAAKPKHSPLPVHVDPLTASERRAIVVLLNLAGTAWHAIDNSEMRGASSVEQGEDEHVIFGPEYAPLEKALDALDALPDDRPGYVLAGAAKAEWALRRLGLSGAAKDAEPALAVAVPVGLHPQTRDLVGRFAEALAGKLRRAEEKYGYGDGWRTDDWEAKCRHDLRVHLRKGDPLDVAIYAAFMWERGWSTAVNHLPTCGGK
jgi:hypothetical protein